MFLKELSVERFDFTCDGCDHTWAVDYDVQHVEDGYGHERDYFFRNGLPSMDPTAPQSVSCPGCGRTDIRARLVARRSTPAVTSVPPSHPGDRPHPERRTDRAQAPLLPGEQSGRGA